jgi:hypothetical protein
MSRWKLIFLSLFAVVAMGAVASASASALEFYVNGTLLNQLLQIILLGGLQRLAGEVAGVKLEVHCKHLDGNGSIHNGLGAGSMLMGLGLALFLYLECTVHAPKQKNVEGCEVAEEKVATGRIHNFVKLLTITLPGTTEPAIEFTPDGGTSFVTIEFINCKNTGLNGGHEVTGFADGMVNNATHEVIAKTGEKELVFAGNEATYEGSAVVEMVGGGFVEVL